MYKFDYSKDSKINNWIVISDVFRNKWNKKSVKCKCLCGKIQDHELSALPSTKKCRECYLQERKKSKEDFYMYRRLWQIKRKYNIDEKEFNKMWEDQKGKCAICNKNMTFPERKRGQKMSCVSVDHNHNTKKVRELLCSSCNKGIGHFNEDSNILLNAIKYLRKHEKTSINTNN